MIITPEEAERAHDIARSVVGGDVTSLVSLAGGEVHAVVRVTTTTDDVVVRLERIEPPEWHPALEGEIAAMELARQLDVPVPDVLHAEPGVLVYRHVAGSPMTETEAAGGLALVAGRLFGRLHSVTRVGVGPVQPDGDDPGWGQHSFFQSVPAEVAVVERLGHRFDGDTALEVVADELLRVAPQMRPRLVHGDASPMNTIVREGRVMALVDSEAAWFADPAVDLAWWWWNSPNTADQFAAGTAETGEPTDHLRTWAHRVRLLIGLAATSAPADTERVQRINMLLPDAIERLRSAV